MALYGFWVAAAGLILSLVFAMLTAWLMNVTNVLPPEINLLQKPLLEERVRPGWYSVVVAFAAGIAGTIALAEDKVDTIVGTVSALALVLAIAAAGIAFMSRDPHRGLGGLLLLAINIALIVIMGIWLM